MTSEKARNKDHITRYTTEKRKLVTEIEAKVKPIFVGLFEEAYQAVASYGKGARLWKCQLICLSDFVPES